MGNQCFFGKCLYYCDPAHGVCGRGSTLEGSFVAFLPNKSLADWSSIKNPWIRSYSKHNRSFWEREDDGLNVCASVRSQMPFKDLTSLLNVVDIHIFDFLIGSLWFDDFSLIGYFWPALTGFGTSKSDRPKPTQRQHIVSFLFYVDFRGHEVGLGAWVGLGVVVWVGLGMELGTKSRRLWVGLCPLLGQQSQTLTSQVIFLRQLKLSLMENIESKTKS